MQIESGLHECLFDQVRTLGGENADTSSILR